MFACIITLVDVNDDLLNSVALMLPKIPRLGELVSINNTPIYQATVTRINNIYGYSIEKPAHEIFENFAQLSEGDYYATITVKNVV